MTYTLEVRTGPDWASGEVFYKKEGIIKNNHVADPDPGFANNQTYCWQVTAVDPYGAERLSNVWSFTVDNQNPLLGWIDGLVYDMDTYLPIPNAQVTASGLNIAMAGDGQYLGTGNSGSYTISVSAVGYLPDSFSGVYIPEGGVVTRNFGLTQDLDDADGDSVPDSSDNCPNMSNLNQADNDSDDIGDVCDDDDDNDGMPDAWENQYGLNPFVDDASDDLDADGYSNYQEYRFGTDPNDPESFPKIKAMPWIPLLLGD